ncbi:hypothetical protein OSTOST_06096 [Ostertagia ostertagi]
MMQQSMKARKKIVAKLKTMTKINRMRFKKRTRTARGRRVMKTRMLKRIGKRLFRSGRKALTNGLNLSYRNRISLLTTSLT